VKNDISIGTNSSTMAYQTLKNRGMEAGSCCQISEIDTGKTHAMAGRIVSSEYLMNAGIYFDITQAYDSMVLRLLKMH